MHSSVSRNSLTLNSYPTKVDRYIDVESELPNSSGYLSHYRFDCINGDPISNGDLIFADQSLLEPFKKAYEAYYHSTEDYGYWMRKD